MQLVAAVFGNAYQLGVGGIYYFDCVHFFEYLVVSEQIGLLHTFFYNRQYYPGTEPAKQAEHKCQYNIGGIVGQAVAVEQQGILIQAVYIAYKPCQKCKH